MQQASLRSPYTGQTLVLLTRHGKQVAIAPVLARTLGAQVAVDEGFDTDSLGTFTRDVARAGSQLEAAVRKARTGMQRSGLPYGLASEGAFVPDPFTGLMPWNVELVVLVDDIHDITVVGAADGPALDLHAEVDDWDSLQAFATRARFPEHQLVLRAGGQEALPLRKGLGDPDSLRAAWDWARALVPEGPLFVEHDLRAHAHPSRMAMIGRAAEDLAARLACACPACQRPGFGVQRRLPGLPCAACGRPTREVRAEQLACVRCGHTEERALPGVSSADPARCDHCNP